MNIVILVKLIIGILNKIHKKYTLKIGENTGILLIKVNGFNKCMFDFIAAVD